MGLLFDSFWRAAAYCVRPRVVLASALPLLLMALLAMTLGYFYWDFAVQVVRLRLSEFTMLSGALGWLQSLGLGDVTSVIAPLLLVLAASPVLVLLSLLLVSVLMTPALVSLVADRRFPLLERKKGGSVVGSLTWSLGSTAMAVVALVISVPLWLIPPLVLILPPLIWGWLTYRVMAFDALADHASKEERKELLRRYRGSLLGMGILTGYLGAAPSIVWASGVVFAAAFFVLVPLAIWIYTLVFACSSLWFSHFCLDALARLRSERAATASSSCAVPPAVPLVAPDALTNSTAAP